jgi:urease accessory protein
MAGDGVTIRRNIRSLLPGLALSLFAHPVHAHLIETGLGPVYDGIVHFALTPEDFVPILALALFAGLRGKEHSRHVILVLPLAWVVGGLAGMLIGVAMNPPLAWLPLLVLGGLVAADFHLPLGATAAIAALLSGFLGYGNGAAIAQAGPGIRGLLGIGGAIFVVATIISAFVVAWKWGWARIAGRVAGSWIAASGLLLLGWSLR